MTLRYHKVAPTNSKGQRFETITQAQEAAELAFGCLIRAHQQQLGADYAHYQIARPGPNDALEVLYEVFVAPVGICHTALSEDLVKIAMLVLKIQPIEQGIRPPIADFHHALIKLLKDKTYYSLEDALQCLQSIVAIMQVVGVELWPKVADLVATGQGSQSVADCICGLGHAFLTGCHLDY